MKRSMNSALAYAFAAMAGGVFFREFTKLMGFTGETTLSVVHTHYFLLGMVFFLLLLLLEKTFSYTPGKAIIAYHVGLNITGVMLLVRGITQVVGADLPKGASASISGIAGIGHLTLGVSMVLLLLGLRKKVAEKEKERV